MKIEDVAMALIDAFTGGGASLWGRQLACSPAQIAQYGYQLKGMGDNVSQKSQGYGFTCTTSIQPNHTGQAGTSAVASYTQQANAMEMINKGLQTLADKVKGVSEFIQKAQTYLRNLLETFRLKIIKLLGSWLGTLVVVAVAMLAVKLIKALINKVASKLGAAGAVVRAVGDKLAGEIQTTLTKPGTPATTPAPAPAPKTTPPPTGTGQQTTSTWVAKPVANGAQAKPMPNVFDNSPF
jgi:hypothetical protein